METRRNGRKNGRMAEWQKWLCRRCCCRRRRHRHCHCRCRRVIFCRRHRRCRQCRRRRVQQIVHGMAEWRDGGMVEWQLNGGMDSTYVAISAILPFCHSFCRSDIPAITAIRPFRLPYAIPSAIPAIIFVAACGGVTSTVDSVACMLASFNFFHSVNNSHIMTNS